MKPVESLNDKVLSGFFIIAICTLTFELLISRVMSVVAWYHFAFMAICLALFGMTIGAVIVHRYKETFFKNFHYVLYLFSLFFSVTLLINLCIICFYPAFTNQSGGGWQITYHPFNIFLIFVSIALPLINSGIIISLVLSRYINFANEVYFIDLAGASLGCLLFIPVINFLGVVNSYFFLAFLGLLATFLFDIDAEHSKRKFIILISLGLVFLMWANIKTNYISLRWAKGNRDNAAFYKKWNSFSYIRIFDLGISTIPQGWGFAPTKRAEIRSKHIDQIYIDIDAIAGTTMINFQNHDLNKIQFLKYDITALPYYLKHNGDVLVIGIGAGRDILTGILFNQKSITGVEINETILNIHQNLLRKYSGDLSNYPHVNFIHNEARSFINASERNFDLIQLSLIDTFAATQAGAYALTENNLYTIEAFKSYFQHLTSDGYISVSYWMHPNGHESMLKLTGAATEALAKSGITNPRDHLVIVHKDGLDDNRGVANLLVKKSPFTNEELSVIQRYCDEMGFHLILSPTISTLESITQMSSTEHMADYAKNYQLNIYPASDDKPFFFLLTRLNFIKFLQDFRLFNFSAEYILFSLLILMFLLTCLFVVFPLLKTASLTQFNADTLPFSIYFTSIGLAFMLIEMSQLTRLGSFLGHPIYGLSIVLFSFLLSSGIGSYIIGRLDDKKKIMVCMSIFIVLCLFCILFTMPLLAYFSKYSLYFRMLVTVAVISPLGFFMGSFLPQGMRLLGQKDGPIALYWGLNGATSVLGSILAMIFQITWGLNMTFLIGTVLYIVAIGTLMKLKFGNPAK